jgi:hypothetical protein
MEKAEDALLSSFLSLRGLARQGGVFLCSHAAGGVTSNHAPLLPKVLSNDYNDGRTLPLASQKKKKRLLKAISLVATTLEATTSSTNLDGYFQNGVITSLFFQGSLT